MTFYAVVIHHDIPIFQSALLHIHVYTLLTHAVRNYDIMKYNINNDLSRLNEWARLWLVDFKTKAIEISTSAVPYLDL